MGSSDTVDVYDSAAGHWLTAALSQARDGVGSLVVDSHVLFLNGTSGSDTVDIYDDGTGQWTSKILPSTGFHSGIVVGAKAVLWCGSEVDVFDAGTGQWSSFQLSQDRRYYNVAKAGSKVLFAGGCAFDADYDKTDYDVVDIYDTVSGQWSRAKLSQARTFIQQAAVGSQVVFAGGFAGNLPSAAVDIYDAATDRWSTASLSEARAGMAQATAGNQILFAGGDQAGPDHNAASGAVDIYDAAAHIWLSTSLSQPRDQMAVATVGTTAFFAGGLDAGSAAVDIYDASSHVWLTAALTNPATNLRTVTVGNQALFAGGFSRSGDTYTWNAAVDIFQVQPPAPHHAAPTAAADAKPIIKSTTAAYRFNVVYTDDDAINAATLRTGNLLVTGPKGYKQVPKFVTRKPAGNAAKIVATYSVAAPKGGWSRGANGVYKISVCANQVADTTKLYAAARAVGTFRVTISKCRPEPAFASWPGAAEESLRPAAVAPAVETGATPATQGADELLLSCPALSRVFAA